MVPAIKAVDEELLARLARMQSQLASAQSASAQQPASEHEARVESVLQQQLALTAAVREAEARAAVALKTALETERRRWLEAAAAAEQTKLDKAEARAAAALKLPASGMMTPSAEAFSTRYEGQNPANLVGIFTVDKGPHKGMIQPYDDEGLQEPCDSPHRFVYLVLHARGVAQEVPAPRALPNAPHL